MAEGYYFPCGCLVEIDAAGNVTRAERCDEHKKRYQHRLERES